MAGPILYRPSPKWQVFAAFGGAILIHALAVLAATHKAPPPEDLSNIPEATVEATLESPPPEEAPTPPPEDIPMPVPPPPPDVQPEFHEEVTPPPNQNKPATIKPIKAPQVTGPPRPPGMMSASQGKANAISAPRPVYPFEARKQHLVGTGVCVVTVDTSSGAVTDATMAKSIGVGILDDAAISAFKRWRFRPGTVSKVKIPITFTMTGASY
ncbi:MAG: energy transducer TonB [Verrucomicrobiota bacterium]|nr:energy transducer TonB [Verrucomicrobiota bacterium]